MKRYMYYYSHHTKDTGVKRFIKHVGKSFGFTLILLGMIGLVGSLTISHNLSGILSPLTGLLPRHAEAKERDFEVFGFAPYWKISNLENVNFDILTTLAYFDVEILSDGSINTDSPGYRTLESDKAKTLFQKAHDHDTKVVLTVTQMDAGTIEAFLDDDASQNRAVENVVSLVSQYGLDGINIDIEYVGTPDPGYRQKFSSFVKEMTDAMHAKNSESQVTVSVYASAAKLEKLYDVKTIAENSDGIFMMAYDFATSGSDTVIPTSPLYGYKEGKYWYDVSTAVEDFLKVMPKEKLILGLPWYGYDYPVETAGVKVPRHSGYYAKAYNRWGYPYSYYVYPEAHAATYADAKRDLMPDSSGWDDVGKVGWISYVDSSGITRQLFLEDEKSLSIKYDFAKQQDLGGVGVWALGFDDGYKDMWALLEEKFGTKKLADSRLKIREL